MWKVELRGDRQNRVFGEGCGEHGVVAGWAADREWSSAQVSSLVRFEIAKKDQTY